MSQSDAENQQLRKTVLYNRKAKGHNVGESRWPTKGGKRNKQICVMAELILLFLRMTAFTLIKSRFHRAVGKQCKLTFLCQSTSCLVIDPDDPDKHIKLIKTVIFWGKY